MAKFDVDKLDEQSINFMLYRLETGLVRQISEECRRYQEDDFNSEKELEAMKQIGRLAARMYNAYSWSKINEIF